MEQKQERIQLLERQVGRVRKRITYLDQHSNRYSWLRVFTFFTGAILALLAFMLIAWWAGLIVLAAMLIPYLILAHYHGQIDRSLTRHSLWFQIKTTQLARMQLRWEQIPAHSQLSPQPEHPFETDLDVTGVRSLHQLLDTAISREGSQRLADWLLSTSPDLQRILQRQQFVSELTPMTRFRDRLQMSSLLSSRRKQNQVEGQRLLGWLGEQTRSPWLVPLLIGSAALNTLTLLLFLLSLITPLPQLWTGTLILSFFLFLGTGNIRGDILDDAVYLRYAFSTLSRIFTFLERYPYGQHLRIKQLCAPFLTDRSTRPSQLLSGVQNVISAATVKNNPLLWVIINTLVPWDLVCAYRLGQYKARIAARLPAWLDAWFELEALCSLATFAYLNPEYVLPEVVENTAQGVCFDAREFGHPLIPDEQKVTNSFALQTLGETEILTGSNMSGKSTFLRTVGVNLCLAYAGGPVNARSLRTSLFRLFTCIRVSDSVTDGYSYFYAEVRRLKALLNALEQPGYPLFFLIDEIFKGTNNRERLIGSRSFVRAVAGRNCVGAISTHDLELVRLAERLPNVKNYHFREEVIDGTMVFDYTLRSGPSPTTNALKIMQMEGLPVVKEEGEDW